ncbi:helix-turn-helix transcriptional regulator [Roseibium litorale]|uniref:Helix-turn-helix transcriptional regulator n=1 Tax=Roseibium litorale TaxID=2803841 RepID=A0ABR9CM43_9HYPH|nr:AraC family transcriptional regulator [Roseibium litorale]MBD8891915.1 helix-turn-helix transcriptional regulator [Roseibium litorale]
MASEAIRTSPPGRFRAEEHRRVVSKVISGMKKLENGDVSLCEWAEYASLSKFELISAFKKLTGIPPMAFHNAEKLEIAKRLLVFERMRVTDVCFEIGFESLGSFVSKFSCCVGISPRNYAKAMSAVGFTGLFVQALLHGKPRSPKAGTVIEVQFESPEAHDRPSLITAVFPRAHPSGMPSDWRFVPPTRRIALFGGGLKGYCLAAALPLWPRLTELVNFRPVLIGRTSIQPNLDKIRVALHPPTIFDPPVTLAVPALFCHQITEVERP